MMQRRVLYSPAEATCKLHNDVHSRKTVLQHSLNSQDSGSTSICVLKTRQVCTMRGNQRGSESKPGRATPTRHTIPRSSTTCTPPPSALRSACAVRRVGGRGVGDRHRPGPPRPEDDSEDAPYGSRLLLRLLLYVETVTV